MGKFCKYIVLGLPVWLVLVAAVSCGDSNCMENRSSVPYAVFYNDSVVPQRISIDSVSVYGIGQPGDSMLLDTARRVSSTYLPLRDGRDTTRFVIRYEQRNLDPRYKADTLTIIYHSYVRFVSAECGAMFNYIIDSLGYTTWQIASAQVVQREVNNLQAENVQLFYRTR